MSKVFSSVTIQKKDRIDEYGTLTDQTNLMAGGKFSDWIKLLVENGGIEWKYYKRLLFVLKTSAMTAPFKIWESLRYHSVIHKTPVDHDPIFIIGHWRSGTTHLHNLLAQDPRWGFFTTFQMFAPEMCLVLPDKMKRKFAEKVPESRWFDNMAMHVNGPQEDDIGLVNMTNYAWHFYFAFPKSLHRYLQRGLLNVSRSEIEEWKKTYMQLVRRATYLANGKQLLLKNPTHFGRISTVLELFPNAKFIHIVRDPYTLLLSVRNLHRWSLRYHRMQDISDEQVDGNIVKLYRAFFKKYLVERPLIPKENLYEIKFEDVRDDPLGHLYKIYEHFGFNNKNVLTRWNKYLNSIKNYKQNSYRLTDYDIQLVNENMKFVMEEYGYKKKASKKTEHRYVID